MCLGSAAVNKNNQIAKHIALYTTECILDEDLMLWHIAKLCNTMMNEK